jgi:hypothetical protein
LSALLLLWGVRPVRPETPGEVLPPLSTQTFLHFAPHDRLFTLHTLRRAGLAGQRGRALLFPRRRRRARVLPITSHRLPDPMATTKPQPIRRCKVALQTPRVDVLAPAHWLGQFIAVTPPAGKARDFALSPGLWVITHRDSGLSAGTLRCSKRQAIAIARQWDGKFGTIDATDARSWPWGKQWGELVRSINAPSRPEPLPEPISTQETAGELAARAGIPIDQAGRSLRIQWRGKFWPAPTDAELEFWTFDSVAETPDGRTVEPDHPESWLRILQLV